MAALSLAWAMPSHAQRQRQAANAAAPPPALGCASLSNLRFLLREAKDDAAAAIRAADSKSDLGCSPVDRQAVTGIVDHVALNGRAYDCLSLQHTGICRWVVAGAVQPPNPAAEPARDSAAPSKAKTR